MEQAPPEGDRRRRKHRSARFYVGDLRVGDRGATWYFSESAERVTYWRKPGRNEEHVVYEGRYYELRSAANMLEHVRRHLARGGHVVIAGLPQSFGPGDDAIFDPYPWIDISSSEDKRDLDAVLPN